MVEKGSTALRSLLLYYSISSLLSPRCRFEYVPDEVIRSRVDSLAIVVVWGLSACDFTEYV